MFKARQRFHRRHRQCYRAVRDGHEVLLFCWRRSLALCSSLRSGIFWERLVWNMSMWCCWDGWNEFYLWVHFILYGFRFTRSTFSADSEILFFPPIGVFFQHNKFNSYAVNQPKILFFLATPKHRCLPVSTPPSLDINTTVPPRFSLSNEHILSL